MKTQYLSLFFNIVKFLSLYQYFNTEQLLKINCYNTELIHMFSIYALTSIKPVSYTHLNYRKRAEKEFEGCTAGSGRYDSDYRGNKSSWR